MWNELSWNLTEKCIPQVYSVVILLLLASCILWEFCALSWETQAVEHGHMTAILWYNSVWNYSFFIKYIEKYFIEVILMWQNHRRYFSVLFITYIIKNVITTNKALSWRSMALSYRNSIYCSKMLTNKPYLLSRLVI